MGRGNVTRSWPPTAPVSRCRPPGGPVGPTGRRGTP